MGQKQGLQVVSEFFQVFPIGGDVQVHNLSGGMDPRIGTPAHMYSSVNTYLGKGILNLPCNGQDIGLYLGAEEPASIIGDDGFDAHKYYFITLPRLCG